MGSGSGSGSDLDPKPRLPLSVLPPLFLLFLRLHFTSSLSLSLPLHLTRTLTVQRLAVESDPHFLPHPPTRTSSPSSSACDIMSGCRGQPDSLDVTAERSELRPHCHFFSPPSFARPLPSLSVRLHRLSPPYFSCTCRGLAARELLAPALFSPLSLSRSLPASWQWHMSENSRTARDPPLLTPARQAQLTGRDRRQSNKTREERPSRRQRSHDYFGPA